MQRVALAAIIVLVAGAGCGNNAAAPGAGGHKSGTPDPFGLFTSREDDEIDLRGTYACWGGTRPTVSYQYTMRSGVKPRENGDYWFVFEHHGARKEHRIGQIRAGADVTAGNSYEDWMESNKDPSPARFWIEFRPGGGRPVRVSQVVSAQDKSRPPGK
jgi:hypothetical protein